MKQTLLAVGATLFIFIGNVMAQQTEVPQRSEEICMDKVKASIAMLDTMSRQKGQEQALDDLTKKDIEEMLQNKSSCEVMQEINKRTMKKQ